MSAPYQLITKDAAADLLCVSKRTIDNWISDGTLPMPTNIGRRVYWHPDVFREWQDKRLGIQVTTEDNKVVSHPRRGRPRAILKMH